MKQFIKKLVQKALTPLENELKESFQRELAGLKDFSFDNSLRQAQVSQTLLWQQYQSLLNSNTKLPNFEETGFRMFSQNDEDGYLLYIFSLIGATNRHVVEICAGNGIECNAANLIINHGWIGLLFDGNEANIEQGKSFYSQCRDTRTWPPRLVHAWINAENVNDLIRDNGVSGEIDLLSLDMDGIDYWIWKAIDTIQPRVVVLEYQDILGPDKAVTVPYQPDFVAEFGEYGPDYCGASLAAFVKLGKEKGYRLVGCSNYGINAFFIRNGIAEDILPEISAKDCFWHPKVQHGMKYRLPNVIDYPWVEV
jgi:hypothetical protein